MTSKTFMTTALPLGVFLLAGCHSKPATQAGTSAAASSNTASTMKARFDPCSVITPDEVAAITTDKVSGTAVIDHDCHYHTTFEEDGTVLAIYPKGGQEQMDDTRSAMKMLGGIGEIVSGQASVGKDVQAAITAPAGGAPALGDEAMWEPNNVLAVRKGDVFVQVTPLIVHDRATHHGAMMISKGDQRMMSQKLAEAVLAKLAP